ncbi:MAG TPA: hypothetical protein VGZ93_07795 [Candidatus Methylacidiphilales bacterium]|jgi:antitoxin (DNA-binding transcriptional repressor) of toxin-antitoxin stability system|nr:hypothetical protein [Candidatus Methylacidiphilales bacterium]
MKTATLRELRTRYAVVMKWIEAGEKVKISRHGKVIARLVPEKPKALRKVDDSFLSSRLGGTTRTTK